MLKTKHKGKASRMKEMRDDLSIIVGAQRSRQIAATANVGSQVGQLSQSPYWYEATAEQNSSESFRAAQSSIPGRIPGAFSIANSTVGFPPPSVTPNVRAARSSVTQYPGQSTRSSWGILRSTPIIRAPTQIHQQSRPTRTPMTSIFRHVQRPPQTPLNSLPASSCNDILLQSPWVTRDLAPIVSQTKTSESTSKFSIIELIDIICQEGAPRTLKIPARPTSNTSEASYRTNKSNGEDFDKNQAFALGRIKLPRMVKEPPMQQSGISSSIFPSQNQPSTTYGSHGKPLDFLGRPSLIDDRFDSSSSFFSTPSTPDQSSDSSFSAFEFPTTKRLRSPCDDLLNTTDTSPLDSGVDFSSISTMSNQSTDQSLYFVTGSPISKRPRSNIVSPCKSRNTLNLTNGFTNSRDSVIRTNGFISSMANQSSSSSSFLSTSLRGTGLPAMGSQDTSKDFLDLTSLNDDSGTGMSFIHTSPDLFEDNHSFNRRREGSNKRKVTFFDDTENVPHPLF